MSLNLGIIASSRQQAAPLLLDQYPGAAAAYSFRKLRTAYTGNCIQVRRSSDNATQDIGFVNNVIDSTTLLTFCGAGNGFVSIWYDQSGNSKNASQATLANQPQIVSSGVIILINGKPSLQVDTTDTLTLSSITTPIRTTFGVIKRTANNSNYFIYGGGISHYHFGNIYYFEIDAGLIQSNAVDNTANQIILSGYNSSPFVGFQYKNNVLIASTTSGLTRAGSIDRLFSASTFFSSGYGQEIIIYSSNNSSNLSAINTNINSFYSIYPVPPVVSDPDAQAFVDRVFAAGGSVTSTEANAVNTLTIGLKASGIWSLMKVIYPMVGASAAACAQNLKSSSFTGTFTSGWTFSTTGATPNGIDAYMDTGLNIGTQLTQTNSHASYYSRTLFDNVNYPTVIGAYGTTSYTQALELYIRRVAPGDKGGGNLGSYTTSVINYTEADARKFAIISRTSATSLKYYTTGVLRATDTVSDTTGFGNVNAYISAGNYVTGAAQNFSRLECAFASIGDGLTDTQASDFYTAVQTFQTSLSRQV
jgi:hypothetical protein